MASESALKLLEESNALLRDMCATLSRIEILLARTPKSRRPRTNTGKPYAKMIAEQREAQADPTPIERTLAAWTEVCPRGPLPAVLDLDRRLILREFWSRLGGEEGVRNVFAVVAASDWLSGRHVIPTGKRAPYARPRGHVTLFETIRNCSEIVEGTYT